MRLPLFIGGRVGGEGVVLVVVGAGISEIALTYHNEKESFILAWKSRSLEFYRREKEANLNVSTLLVLLQLLRWRFQDKYF